MNHIKLKVDENYKKYRFFLQKFEPNIQTKKLLNFSRRKINMNNQGQFLFPNKGGLLIPSDYIPTFCFRFMLSYIKDKVYNRTNDDSAKKFLKD